MLLILFVPCKSLANLCFYSGHFTSTEAGQDHTPSYIIAQLNRTELRSGGDRGSEQCGRQGRAMHSKNLELRSSIEVHFQFLLNPMKDKETDKSGLIPPNIR